MLVDDPALEPSFTPPAVLDPHDPAALRAAGLTAFRAGRWAEARVFFQDELQLVPTRAATHFNLASAEYKLGDFLAAEIDYRAACADPALAPLATLNAGLAADSAGLHDTAEALYREAARLDGAGSIGDKARDLSTQLDADLLAQRRALATRLGRSGRAALKANHAVDAATLLWSSLDEARAGHMKDADRAELEYALGHALRDEKRAAEATAAFRRALAGKPGEADLHYMLAVALHDSGTADEAAAQFRAALAAGLDSDDAVRAGNYLGLIARETAPPPPRATVDAEASVGYDSNYAGGREVVSKAFQQQQCGGGASAQTKLSGDAPEVSATVEPRLRLHGRPIDGLYLGLRLDALLYLSCEADPFSLIDTALYLEGNWSPTDWLTLTLIAQGYFETESVLHLQPYQTGAQLTAKAILWEGDSFATRLRYTHTFITSLDHFYGYLTGQRDEVALNENWYVHGWRVSAGYQFRHEGVGIQTGWARDVLPPLPLGDPRATGTSRFSRDQDLRCQLYRGAFCRNGADLQPFTGASFDPSYSIPWAYDGHELILDGDGVLFGGFQLDGGVRYQHRDYLGSVTITPDPHVNYHSHRVEDRLSFDLAVKHLLGWGLYGRFGVSLLVSLSNIDNTAVGSSFDFDNRNFTRFLATLDLLRAF